MIEGPVRLELVAVTGLPAGTRLPLRLGENVVGRDDWVDVPVSSPLVSRRHAVVRVRAGGYVLVRDLASRNGTRINGTRIDDEVPVALGDLLEIGDVALRLTEVSRSTASPPGPGGATAVGLGGAAPAGIPSASSTAPIPHDAPTGLLPRLSGPALPPEPATSGGRAVAPVTPSAGVPRSSESRRAPSVPGRTHAGGRERVLGAGGAVLLVLGLVLLVVAGSAGVGARLAFLALAVVGAVLFVRSGVVSRD